MPARLILLLALAISGSWAYLYQQAWEMQHLPMDQMWMPPATPAGWHLADFGWIFAMWAVMMAAMMLPSALPMLAAFSRYCRHYVNTDSLRTLWFAGGYLAVWLLFSVVLTLAQWRLHGWAWLSPMMETQQPAFAAAVVFVAGAYQFTWLKNACLAYCRTPFGYLVNHWQPGNAGAFRVGFRHGLGCLGCCWAQMLLMFAVGVMNLAGMLFITLLVIVEKWAPIEAGKLRYAIGALFLGWGAYLGWQIALSA